MQVFPAGGSKQSWMDNISTTASEEVVEEIGVAGIPTTELQRMAQGFVEVDEVELPEGDEAPQEIEIEISEEITDDIDSTEEVIEDVAEGSEEGALDEAAVAVEDAKALLDNASDALADAGAVVEDIDEVAELPVSLEGDEIFLDAPEDDAEVVVEIEGEEEEIEESSELAAAKGECEKDDETNKGKEKPCSYCSADTASRFTKIANLSPANKKKLSTYWIKNLGYDAEYVSLMLKDYKG